MIGSLNTLSTATGIPSPELLAMLADVKANSALLQGCKRHTFKVLPIPVKDLGTTYLGRKYACEACKGTVDGIAARWYMDGLAHAAA